MDAHLPHLFAPEKRGTSLHSRREDQQHGERTADCAGTVQFPLTEMKVHGYVLPTQGVLKQYWQGHGKRSCFLSLPRSLSLTCSLASVCSDQTTKLAHLQPVFEVSLHRTPSSHAAVQTSAHMWVYCGSEGEPAALRYNYNCRHTGVYQRVNKRPHNKG